MTVQTIIRLASCRDCDAPFEAEEVQWDGRPLLRRMICPTCAAKIPDEPDPLETLDDELRGRRLASIPAEFRGATLEHSKVKAWCEGFLTGEARWLLLQGQVGRGKTHHAWACWRRIAHARPRLRMVAWRVETLLNELRAAGRDGYAELRRAQHADLLLLDDLATAEPSEWAVMQLGELIGARVAEQRVSILTTNTAAHRLEEILGERIASRLDGVCDVVTITGPDRRRS